MDIHKIKRDLSRCTVSELQELRRYATERIAVLKKQNRVASHEQAWEAVGKHAKPGMYLLMVRGFSGRMSVWRKGISRVRVSRDGRKTTVIASTDHVALSGGTVMKVDGVQPRKRVLWLESVTGDIYAFKPPELAEIGPVNIRLFPDELRANVAKVKLCGNELGPSYTGPSLGNGGNP